VGRGQRGRADERPRLVFPELNELAKIVKAIDPNHPTDVVIAGGEPEKIEAFNEHVPRRRPARGELVRGGHRERPRHAEGQRVRRPYLVTEWGPRGHWQSPKTEWGAPLEQTSTQKAESFRMGYEAAIASQPEHVPGVVRLPLGAEAGEDGDVVRHDPAHGETTQTLDTMTEMWTGNSPNSGPRSSSRSIRPPRSAR
jgi:hypothetical protein